MKCKNCGKFIKEVKCHIFNREGGDSYIKALIYKPKQKNTCYSIQVPDYCTMFEVDSYYNEFIEQISCPCCGEFPFKQEGISIATKKIVIFGISPEPYINDDEDTNKNYKKEI